MRFMIDAQFWIHCTKKSINMDTFGVSETINQPLYLEGRFNQNRVNVTFYCTAQLKYN